VKGPSDARIAAVIAKDTGRDVDVLQRGPYEYATSAALEELVVSVGGIACTVIVKHLAWHGLLDDARTSKPPWLHEPRREFMTYRLLAPEGIGPHCYGGASDVDDAWVVIDKAAGVELWQIGEHRVWEAVAAWMAGFHQRFSGRLDAVREANPHLLEYRGDWMCLWAARAVAAVERSGDPRAGVLTAALHRFDETVAAMDALPGVFVHGEFYPSNVLVRVSGNRAKSPTVDVRPVDWEMSGIGPAALDLAALAGGFGPDKRNSLVAAYERALPEPQPDLRADVNRARLNLAVRWLGWADQWTAPAEHANDWVSEALDAAADLGLV